MEWNKRGPSSSSVTSYELFYRFFFFKTPTPIHVYISILYLRVDKIKKKKKNVQNCSKGVKNKTKSCIRVIFTTNFIYVSYERSRFYFVSQYLTFCIVLCIPCININYFMGVDIITDFKQIDRTILNGKRFIYMYTCLLCNI